MLNFVFLTPGLALAPFADVAAVVEMVLYIAHPAACVLSCYRAMEIAVKWRGSVTAPFRVLLFCLQSRAWATHAHLRH